MQELLEEFAKAPVVTYLDNDNTLTIWTDGRYGKESVKGFTDDAAKEMSDPDYASNSFVVLSTGRALSGVRPAAPFLYDAPVHMLSAANGLALFINEDGRPAGEWIQSLSLADQDRGWQEELRAVHGWDQDAVMKTMQAALSLAGFVPGKPLGYAAFDPDRTAWVRPSPDLYPDAVNIDYTKLPQHDMVVASFYEDGNSIVYERCKAADGSQPGLSPSEFSYFQEIHRDVIDLLAQSGTKLKTRFDPYRHTMLFDLNPAIGDGKAILLDYILRTHFPAARDVIAAGDSSLDKDVLSIPSFRYQDESGVERDVRMHPIQVGDNATLKEALASNPDTIQVPFGGLARGLRQQFDKIAADRGL